MIGALERAWRRFVGGVVRHVRMLVDPESMLAALIVTIWAALAGMSLGTIGVVSAVIIAWFLHGAAVETGNHVSLWLSTAALLILVVVASATTLGGPHPVILAAAGASVLAHNELVRLNYTRRRYARVESTIFESSAVSLVLAAVLAMFGAGIVDVLVGSGNRTWLWMPIATGALLAVALGLSTLPTRRASEASRQRWLPGERLPPPGSAPDGPPPPGSPPGPTTGGPWPDRGPVATEPWRR